MRPFYIVESAVRMLIYSLTTFVITLFVELTLFKRIVFLIAGIIWIINPLIEFYHNYKEDKK